MSIAEKLATTPEARVNCKTCVWLEDQSDVDRKAIQAAIENPSWSVDALARVLKDDGLPVGTSAFRYHIAQGH